MYWGWHVHVREDAYGARSIRTPPPPSWSYGSCEPPAMSAGDRFTHNPTAVSSTEMCGFDRSLGEHFVLISVPLVSPWLRERRGHEETPAGRKHQMRNCRLQIVL